MRRSCLTLCAIACIACRNTGRAASAADTASIADTTVTVRATSPAATPEPAPLRLADLAGKWKVTATNAVNDSTLVTYEMTATADTTGWFIMYPTHAKPIALHVKVDADSVIMDAGPYASTARSGATVTIHGVGRIRDAHLVGTEAASYTVKGVESVVHIRLDGTRTR